MNISSHTTTAASCTTSSLSSAFRALSRASTVLMETAHKIASIAGHCLMKGAALAHSGMSGAWSITKILGQNLANLAVRIGHASLAFLHLAYNKIGQCSIALAQLAQKALIVAGLHIYKMAVLAKAGAQICWNAAINFGGKTLETLKIVSLAVFAMLKKMGSHFISVSQKVCHLCGKILLAIGRFAAQVGSSIKTGIVQGFIASKLFFATHQKETMLVGCGIAIGASALYIAQQILAARKPEIQPQTV